MQKSVSSDLGIGTRGAGGGTCVPPQFCLCVLVYINNGTVHAQLVLCSDAPPSCYETSTSKIYMYINVVSFKLLHWQCPSHLGSKNCKAYYSFENFINLLAYVNGFCGSSRSLNNLQQTFFAAKR